MRWPDHRVYGGAGGVEGESGGVVDFDEVVVT